MRRGERGKVDGPQRGGGEVGSEKREREKAGGGKPRAQSSEYILTTAGSVLISPLRSSVQISEPRAYAYLFSFQGPPGPMPCS